MIVKMTQIKLLPSYRDASIEETWQDQKKDIIDKMAADTGGGVAVVIGGGVAVGNNADDDIR